MNNIAIHVVEKAAQGDMEAFEEIYRATSGFVYNVALGIMRNDAQAQEVTQDVFMKIYRQLKNFQFRSSFKTWVYRITVNTAINYCRQSRREQRNKVDQEHIIETLPSSESAAQRAIQADYQGRLDALMSILSPEHKACLVLREIEGLSYQDMATALKVPVNTVRSRLNRARQALIEEARKEPEKNEL